MKNRVFLDTNILIYALTKPKVAEDIYKRDIAIKLLENLIQQNDIYISIQILNEVHVNLVKKFKIDDEKVFKTIKDNILAIASVNDMSFQTYQRAFKLRKKYNISYWDSLVVSSSTESDCKTLYSEDMQDNLIIENKLQIINPFK